MRLGLSLILNSLFAWGSGKSLAVALIALLAAAVFAPATAHASCGDYVMIGGGHDIDSQAFQPMTGPSERSNVPPPPCSGPECKRNSPAAPMTPPVKSNDTESRSFGALFDLALISVDSGRGLLSDELHPAVPDPALDAIFHPPR